MDYRVFATHNNAILSMRPNNFNTDTLEKGHFGDALNHG
jgi:hypothetical protein